MRWLRLSAGGGHWCGPCGAGAGAGKARGWFLYHYLLIIVLFSLPATTGPALSELRSANSGAQAREGTSEACRAVGSESGCGPSCPAAQRQPGPAPPPLPAPQLLAAPVSARNSAQHIGTRKPMGTRPAPRYLRPPGLKLSPRRHIPRLLPARLPVCGARPHGTGCGSPCRPRGVLAPPPVLPQAQSSLTFPCHVHLGLRSPEGCAPGGVALAGSLHSGAVVRTPPRLQCLERKLFRF